MAVCEKCGAGLGSGDAVVFTPSGKVGASISVCQQCAHVMEAKLLPKIGLLNVLGGLLLGVVFAALASAAWYFITVSSNSTHVIFAMGMGAFVGLGVYLGSGMKKSYLHFLIGAVLAGLAMGFGMYLVVRQVIMTKAHLEHGRMFIPPAVMLRMIVGLIRVEPILAFDWLAAIVAGGGVLFPRKYSVSGQRMDPLLSDPQNTHSAAIQPDAAKSESESRAYVLLDILAVFILVLVIWSVFASDSWMPFLERLLMGFGLTKTWADVAQVIIDVWVFGLGLKCMFLLFVPRDLYFSPVNAENLPALDQWALPDYTTALESLGFVQLGDYLSKGKMLLPVENSFQRVFFHPVHRCYAAVVQSMMSGNQSSATQYGLLSIFDDGWTLHTTPTPSQDMALFRDPKSAWFCHQKASPEKILSEHLELTAQFSRRQGVQLKGDGSVDTYIEAVREMQQRKRAVIRKKSVLAAFGRMIAQGVKPRSAWLVDPPSAESKSPEPAASSVESAGQVARPRSGDSFYRMLGSVARVSAEMRRFSINGMPSNYLVIVGLGFVVYFTGQSFWEALRLRSSGYPPGYLAMIIPAVLGAGVLVMMVAVIGRKYIIFRPMPSSEVELPVGSSSEEEEEQIDLRITGKLHLDSKIARRFLDVPTGLGRLDTGERVFLSRIDASATMYGMRTNNLQGIWALAIKPETLKLDSEGTLYLGQETRPSLRLSFTDLHTGKPTGAVLSFGSEIERSRVRGMLGLR